MTSLTTLGSVHAALASAGIVIGFPQLWRRKGGSVHRVLGYAYVAVMVVADGSALLVFQFTGRLNVLHAGAVINLACLAAGLWPVLRHPRQADWFDRHRIGMAGSYIGLLAAAATELTVRTVPFASMGEVWTATAVVTLAVWAAGRRIVRRPVRSGAD